MKALKISFIVCSIFVAIPVYANNTWEKCKDNIVSKALTGGPDLYDKIIKKCGYEQFTKENCNDLYNELYLECYKEKYEGFSSAEIGYFALFKNFDDNKLSKSCADKKQLSRDEFGKIFCEGK